MKSDRIRRALCISICLAAAPPLASAATGTLMEITSKSEMQMPGMPPQAAAMMNRSQVIKRCIGSDHIDDPMSWTSGQQRCTTSDVHRTATGMTAHVACDSGGITLTGDMVVQKLAGGVMHATIHTTGSGHGVQMKGVQDINAKPVGTCTLPGH